MAIGRTPDIWVGCRTDNVMSYSQLIGTTTNIWRKKTDFKIGKYRIRMGSFAWWCRIASGVDMLYMVMLATMIWTVI